MANILKIKNFEECVKDEFKRICEENLVMDDTQAGSYHVQSDWGGDMDPMHLFHLTHICKIIKQKDTVVDLACGTGDLLIKVAELFPLTQFIGIDLSEDMLAKAKCKAEKLKLSNLSFLTHDISNIDSLKADSVDVVLSTMALHHLPNKSILINTAKEVNRILKSNGSIYLSDFLKLKSIDTVNYLVACNRNQDDKIFQLDFRNSLLAAFSKEDYIEFCGLITKTDIKLKKSAFANIMFTITSKNARFSFTNFVRAVRSIPWKKIDMMSLIDFIQLKLIVDFL